MDREQRIEAWIQRGRQTEGTSGKFEPRQKDRQKERWIDRKQHIEAQIQKDKYIWIESNIQRLRFREVGKQKEHQEYLNLDKKKDRQIER